MSNKLIISNEFESVECHQENLRECKTMFNLASFNLSNWFNNHIYLALRSNRLRLLVYLGLSLLLAYFISIVIGDKFEASELKTQGAPRRVSRAIDNQEAVKDPFSNRPRIQTRNGHLVIEASQDKNIEFRTSGVKGTVSINGLKLDQLFAVTKALDKTTRVSQIKVGNEAAEDPTYETVLRTILGSGNKIVNLEKLINNLKSQLNDITKSIESLNRRVAKRKDEAKKLARQQETVLVKLKQNDCFDQETGQPVCKEGATCIDSYEGFKCLCPSNYEGTTCEKDVDECSLFHGTDLGCQNGAKCINFPGGFRCECPPQYHGVFCTEQHDDCALSSSRSLCGHGKCVSLARTEPNQPRYECSCDQGWTRDASNPACVVDIDECVVGQVLNVSINTQVVASSGFFSYPCSQNPFVECINLPGSFQCAPCPSGYSGNGRVCSDSDECLVNNGGCSTNPLVECINTPGSRRCGRCPPGYNGDGQICNPISACALEQNGGCHPMAKCVELSAVSSTSRICICQYPYEGNGIGNFGCKLITGRVPSGSGMVNETNFPIKDECQPNPCLNGASCTKTDDSFECICARGWSGRTCDEPQSCGGSFVSGRGSIVFPPDNSFDDLTKQIKAHRSRGQQQTKDMTQSDQTFRCTWNFTPIMSDKVLIFKFSQMSNSLYPYKKVAMLLANTSFTENSMDLFRSTCAESLEVYEILQQDSDENLNGLVLNTTRTTKISSKADTNPMKRRLIASFCPDLVRSNTKVRFVDSKESIELHLDTNIAQIEYAYSFTRMQDGNPRLIFNLNWGQKSLPCGGFYKNSDSGSITSPNFPSFYAPGIECRYTIQVAQGKRIRIQFGDITLLSSGQPLTARWTNCVDSLTIYDGMIGEHRPILFRQCGNNVTSSSEISPIVSSSSKVEIVLDSELSSTWPILRSSNQKKGFYLTYASEASDPACGGLYTAKFGTIKSTDYEPETDDLTLNENDSKFLLRRQKASLNWRDATMNYTNNLSTSPLSYRKIRCEYELRPADQLRNHHVSIDWIDMPNGGFLNYMYSSIPNMRRFGCPRSQLTIYDSFYSSLTGYDKLNNTSTSSNWVKTFCPGNKYSSRDQIDPNTFNDDTSRVDGQLISSGHSLFLVYEARVPVENQQDTGTMSNIIGTRGFKLHYSTVCTATLRQRTGQATIELGPEVKECIYHIILPANNSISLIFELQSSGPIVLPDGNCALEAYFSDGVIDDPVRSLARLESKMELDKSLVGQKSKSAFQVSRAGSNSRDDPDELSVTTSTTAPISNSSATIVQYQHEGSSIATDIKEFDLCRAFTSSQVSFDSIWNHVSFLVRLRQPQVVGTDENRRIITINIKYQAEPACGGVITEPKAQTLMLDSAQKIESMERYPITATKFEQLHRDEFTSKCAWILKAESSELIQLQFELADTKIRDAIQDTFDRWRLWAKKQTNLSVELNECSQIYYESLEIYEPSLNRSRILCPIDLIQNKNHTWTTQTNIVYLRLRNETSPSEQGTQSNKTVTKWSGKKPLGKMNLIARYKFIITNSRGCGGKLLQDSGFIRSPRYPYNYPGLSDCTWIIEVNPRQQIRLNVTKFELEGGTNNCPFDYLEIRNGPVADSPLVGKFCNKDLQGMILISHSNYLWLRFVSDNNLNKKGFEILYDGALSGCGGHLTSASGQIDSPNYPLPFGRSAKCEWTIEISQASRIALTIDDLDLNSQSVINDKGCGSDKLNDYIEIFDADSWNGQTMISLGKLCHMKQLNDSIRKFKSNSNRLRIVYESQALDNSRGFRINYKTDCFNIELNGMHGAIESPGFPFGYVSNLDCGWLIRGSMGTKIRIALSNLDLEDTELWNLMQTSAAFVEPINRTASKCNEDSLQVWTLPPTNGSDLMSPLQLQKVKTNQSQTTYIVGLKPSNTTSFSLDEVLNGVKVKLVPKDGKLVRSYCNHLENLDMKERVLEIESNLVYVSFKSDYSVSGSGFRLEWQAIGCGGEVQVLETGNTINFRETPSNQSRPYECLWLFSRKEFGKRIELSIDADMRQTLEHQTVEACNQSSLSVYDGPTKNNPLMTKICGTRRNFVSVISNRDVALVRFYSDGQHYYGHEVRIVARTDLGNHCQYYETPSNPTSFKQQYNRLDTIITQPPPAVLSQDSNTDSDYISCNQFLYGESGRLMLHIDELDIQPSTYPEGSPQPVTELLSQETCERSTNSLSIVAKLSTLGYFCGRLSDSEQTNNISTTLILERGFASLYFKAQTKVGARWKLRYGTLCGSLITIRRQMDFATPQYPAKPGWPNEHKSLNQLSENVCIWKFETESPKDSGHNDFIFGFSSRNQDSSQASRLYFSLMDFVESEYQENDCLRVFEGVNISLKQNKFNLTDLDESYGPKLKLCKRSDLTRQSLSYVSQGSTFYVLTSGALSAKFSVQPFENYCGGEFHHEEAQFASPNYPNQYGTNLDCYYLIVGSPGSRISLKFIDLFLQNNDDSIGSENCDNMDRVEIYQLTGPRRNDYRYYQSFFARLQEFDSSKSFLSVNKNSSLDQIISRHQSRVVELARNYQMFQVPRKGLSLADIHHAVLIDKYCAGKKIPTLDQDSLRGEILIRFQSINGTSTSSSVKSKERSRRYGFLVDYKIRSGGLIRLDANSPQASTGVISSPMYPTLVQTNSTTVWHFEANPPDSVILFDLVSLSLGSGKTSSCEDTLRIFDGLRPSSDPQLVEFCGQLRYKIHGNPMTSTDITVINQARDPVTQSNLIRTIQTTRNSASVLYDNSELSGQFLLRYRAIRRADLVSIGIINNTNINSTLSYLQDVPLSVDDALKQQNMVPSPQPNVSRICSDTFLLSSGPQNESLREIQLQSPNWPKEPERSLECHWMIYTHENRNIRFGIDLSEYPNNVVTANLASDYCFDPQYSKSKRGYVTVHDGSSPLSPEIGRFCLPSTPTQFQSSGRYLFVRFVFHSQSLNTDDSMQVSTLINDPRPKRFKGRVSLTKCGGQYYTTSADIVNDREYNPTITNYENNVDCKYYIFAESSKRSLSFYWQRFELASEPTNSDCSVGDYVEVRQLLFTNVASDDSDAFDDTSPVSYTVGRSLGRFCAGRQPAMKYIEVFGSGALLEFHTDDSNTARGWRLLFFSQEAHETCKVSRYLTDSEPFALVSSPGWPHGFFGERDCLITLVAPSNQTIKFDILRYRRSKAPINLDGQDRCLDKLAYIDDVVLVNTILSTPTNLFKDPDPIARKLIHEIPCNFKARIQVLNDNVFPDRIESSSASSIRESEYFSMLNGVSDRPPEFTVQTESNSLLINYRASNSGYGEGFVAVGRISDAKRRKCGGKVTQNEHLIESGAFNKEMNETDQFVQCLWEFMEPSSWGSMHGSHVNLLYDNSKLFFDNYAGNFQTAFIVFQALEIPTILPGKSLIGKMKGSYINPDEIDHSFDDVCGPYRMKLRDPLERSIIACGNLTRENSRWLPIRSVSSELLLRTKNLKSSDMQLFRGLRAYYYRSKCANIEIVQGNGLNIKSGINIDTNYVPSICWWKVELNGGNFELWFDRVHFRPTRKINNNTSSNNSNNRKTLTSVDVCNIEKYPDLDYIEIRASELADSPVLERFCSLNEDEIKKQGRILTNTDGVLSIYFVAGLEYMSKGLREFPVDEQRAKTNETYNFNMAIVPARNLSEFCRYHSAFNLYQMLINVDRTFYSIERDYLQKSQMYPKDTHCTTILRVDKDSRLNFSFVGLFDMESSPNCKNDYVQLENLSGNENNGDKSANGNNSSTMIGRWCGRNKIDGYFLSNSSRVKLTFHSNSNIEGRGFRLIYREFANQNKTNQVTL